MRSVPVVLVGPGGLFSVKYNEVDAAHKNQRWTVLNGSDVVVASYSDYWQAVLSARRRSLGTSK